MKYLYENNERQRFFDMILKGVDFNCSLVLHYEPMLKCFSA